MKNLVIRTVFTLTLLLTLAAIFAGVNPALAHADSPTPIRVDCASELSVMEISTDRGQNQVCFGGTGTIPVVLYNASMVCAGRAPSIPSSSVTWRYDGRGEETTPFPAMPPGAMRACICIDRGYIPCNNVALDVVNQVLSISISPN